MRIGEPRRLLDLRLRGPRPAIGDVLGQRAVKQDRLLLHDGDLRCAANACVAAAIS